MWIALLLFACAGVSWARFGWIRVLRVDDLSLTLAQRVGPCAVFGILIAAAGWRYRALFRDPALSMRALLVWAVGAHLAAACSLPLTSNDIFSNLAYGHLAALGFNPYRSTPMDLPAADAFAAVVGSRWRGTPIVYGPILVAVNAVVARVGSVPAALCGFKLLMLGATLGAVFIAYRVCRDHLEPDRARPSFVLFAFSPCLLWELSAQAHNDAVMVLAMVAFVWAALCDRQWLAGACLSVALFAKLATAPIIVFYLVMVARTRLLRAVGMVVMVACLGAATIGSYWDGLHTLAGPAGTLGGQVVRTSRSFGDLLYWCALPFGTIVQIAVYRVAWAVGTGLLVVMGIRAVTKVRTVEDVVHHSLLWLGAYCLVGSPWFQPWYVAWLLPFALVHRDARWQNLVVLYAALVLVQYVLPLDPTTSVIVDLVIIAQATKLLRLSGRHGRHVDVSDRRPTCRR